MVVALCGSKCLPAPFSSFVLPQDIYEARGADIWFGSPGRTLARLSLSFSRKNEAHFFSSSLQLFAASHHAFPNELVHTRPFIVCRLTSPTSLFCVIIKHGLEPARQSAFPIHFVLHDSLVNGHAAVSALRQRTMQQLQTS
jgi:hypothetical protein